MIIAGALIATFAGAGRDDFAVDDVDNTHRNALSWILSASSLRKILKSNGVLLCKAPMAWTVVPRMTEEAESSLIGAPNGVLQPTQSGWPGLLVGDVWKAIRHAAVGATV